MKLKVIRIKHEDNCVIVELEDNNWMILHKEYHPSAYQKACSWTDIDNKYVETSDVHKVVFLPHEPVHQTLGVLAAGYDSLYEAYIKHMSSRQ